MSRVLVQVFASGKDLETIEIDIRKALVTADAVEVDTEYISDAIGSGASGDRADVVAWADRVFPKRWGFHEDRIVIDRGID